MRTFLWCGYASYFLIGLAHVVIGSVLPELLGHYGKDYASGGQLIALQFAGFLAGVLSGPWWSQRLGKRGALLLALTCLSLGELTLAWLPPWTMLLGIAPFAGFGFGMIETVIGALVIQYIEEGYKTKAMTRLEVFFGVGALAMPLVSALLIASGWWRGGFLLLGAASVTMLLLWALLPLGQMASLMNKPGEPGAEQPVHGDKASQTGRRPVLYLTVFIMIFLVYVGTEMSIANFLPSMLVETLALKPEIGALSVTCFWGAMSVGRLFAAGVVDRVGATRYLLWSGAGCTVMLAGLALATGIWSSFLLILLIGLMMSGMFAILLIYANGFFPGAEERVTSFLIASGGIGGALLPMLTGWFMDRFTVQHTLWVLVGFAALLWVLLVGACGFLGQRKLAER
jgi:MFS transporter, FHS family, glucose/mannose:H+ symporter